MEMALDFMVSGGLCCTNGLYPQAVPSRIHLYHCRQQLGLVKGPVTYLGNVHLKHSVLVAKLCARHSGQSQSPAARHARGYSCRNFNEHE